jgi:hypothetical protein
MFVKIPFFLPALMVPKASLKNGGGRPSEMAAPLSSPLSPSALVWATPQESLLLHPFENPIPEEKVRGAGPPTP